MTNMYTLRKCYRLLSEMIEFDELTYQGQVLLMSWRFLSARYLGYCIRYRFMFIMDH